MTKNTFAVIETGGKQYLVKPGDVIRIERIEKPKKGDVIHFDEVLLFFNEGEINPHTKGSHLWLLDYTLWDLFYYSASIPWIRVSGVGVK